MRHKYSTRAFVLARHPLGEANALLTLLTHEVGVIRVRAQGLRKSGAKLSAALATFAVSDVVVLRGAEGWRLSGAVLVESFARRLPPEARAVAARFVGLLLRLAPIDSAEPTLFPLVEEFFAALLSAPQEAYRAIECLAALRLLASLGLLAGELPPDGYAAETLALVEQNRRAYVARVNHGLEASGL